MHLDDPSNPLTRKALADTEDARLAVNAFMARTKLDMGDGFAATAKDVNDDPAAFEERSRKVLDQTLSALPSVLLPEQKQFLQAELEEDRALMLNDLRTAALDRDRIRHNGDLARVTERFTEDGEAEAHKLGFGGEGEGDLRSIAVRQCLGKAELAIGGRTDLTDDEKQTLLAQSKFRIAEAAVQGDFDAALAGGPDDAQRMIDGFRAMKDPEGIDKEAQEAIAAKLGGQLRDARNKPEVDKAEAETQAAIEGSQAFTELEKAVDDGQVGHGDIQAANVTPDDKSNLTARLEAREAEETKRRADRSMIARIIHGKTEAAGVAEGEHDGVFPFDPNNPDHQAAVDDYFDNVVVPSAPRVFGAAKLIAATGLVPEGVKTRLFMELGLPPDTSEDPDGPTPRAQVSAAKLVWRIDRAAPGALDTMDYRIRDRADAIMKLMRTGIPPEQAARHANVLMVAAAEKSGDDGQQGGTGDDQLAMGAFKEGGKALARKLFPEAARRMGRQIQRKLREKLNREAGAGRKKLAPDSKPVDPDRVVDAFGTALDTINAARALKKLKPKKKAEITLDDLGTDDEAGAVQGFVEAWMEGRLLPTPNHTAQLNLGPVDPDFAARLKKDTGVDVSGLNDAIDTGQITHAFNSHGPGNEKDADQEPISPEAISIYRQVVRNYDRITKIEQQHGGTTTIRFEKDVNGVIAVVEQVRRGSGRRGSAKTERGEFAFFTMWIKKR